MSKSAGVVYLLHFDTPIGSAKHQAQHYIGWARSLADRLADHQRGAGARITAFTASVGISWQLARTWDNKGRTFERQLKRSHNHRRFCPVCREQRNRESTQS